MYRKRGNSWIKHLDFIIVDSLAVFIAFLLACLIRFGTLTPQVPDQDIRLIFVFLVVSEIMASLFLNNLNNIIKRGFYIEFVNVFALAFAITALVSLLLYSSKLGQNYSRLMVLYTVGVFIPLDLAFRTLLKAVIIQNLKLRRSSGLLSKGKPCFVVSDSKNISSFIEAINNDIYDDYRVKGVSLPDYSSSLSYGEGIVVCPIDETSKVICREWIDEVFIFNPDNSFSPDLLMKQCAEMGVTVHTVLNIKSAVESKQSIESFDDHVMITSAFSYISTYQVIVKRIGDIIGGLIGSILAILIGLVIGPIIYINSPGPILFKQKRVGKNGKIFEMLKFRSMVLDADQKKEELMKDNILSSDLMFKVEHDPRVIGTRQLEDGTWKTGIGDFIRRTSLDEFPQFFNVLKGDMSLVGTRPPTVDEWNQYEYHHRARLAVKPGITGLWQVSGRNEIKDFEEVVKLDTEYIVNFRLSQDIKILFKTIAVLLNRKGAM